jgi:signal transduction histidine kinase
MDAQPASSPTHKLMKRQLRERGWIERVDRVVLPLFMAVVVLVFVVLPVQTLTWLRGTPYLGALVCYPLTVDLLAPASPSGEAAESALLRQGDTILAVDGQPVDGSPALYALLRAHPVGETVALTVATDGETPRDLPVTLRPMPVGAVLPRFVVPYLAGLAWLAIGGWVYVRRRSRGDARVFVAACLLAGLALATTFDLKAAHLFVRAWTAALPLAGGYLLVLSMIYPSETGPVAQSPWLRWLPLLAALSLVVWGQLRLGLGRPAVVGVWLWSGLFALTAVVIFILALLGRGIFSAVPTVREQSQTTLVAAFIAFLPLGLSALGWVDLPVGWLVLASILFPLVIAYNITQYSVLGSRRIGSLTATYAVMAVIVVVGYSLFVMGVSQLAAAFLLGAQIDAASPLLIGLLAFALVLGFQPLRETIRKAIDRLFFRSQEESTERLAAFRQNLTLASDLSEVVDLIKDQIARSIVPIHTYVFLRSAQTGHFVALSDPRRPDTDIRFEEHSALVHYLAGRREVVFLELNKPLPPELAEEQARLGVLRAPLIAPLQGQEHLIGWIAVGSKRSGESFSLQELHGVQAIAEQASLAVERAQVVGDLERRVHELDILRQVAQAANFTVEPDVLMDLVYAQCSRLIDTTNFYIIQHHPEQHMLSYAFFLENDERDPQHEAESWPDTVGLESEVVRTGRPILANDFLEECARRNVVTREGRQPRAWLGVPLNVGTTTWGAMAVAAYRRDVQFTEEQLRIFWSIADQAATALDKARLFEETERRARQLATLNAISTELSTTLDLESLLQRIVHSAVQLIGTEAGTLFLMDEVSGNLVFRVVEGGAQDLIGKEIPADKGIVGQTVQSGQPVISNDVLSDVRWFSQVDRETAFQTRSLLAAPLMVQDRSIGAVEVINRRDGTPFDEEDAALLTAFASQAAIAVANARLYQDTDAALTARVEELQMLQRIDRELNQLLHFDRVVALTLDWALRSSGFSAGMVVMQGGGEAGLEVVAHSGYAGDFVAGLKDGTLSPDVGIAGRALRTGQPEYVQDVSADPDYVVATDTPSAQEIVVPIRRAGSPVGALVLEHNQPDPLAEQGFEFVQRIVEHASVAIENARLLGEVEAANRSKTEFVSFVAHELKNPMTSIRGYTDLLKAGHVGEVSEQQVQFLGTIRSNVDRMTRLVSDLADVMRMETGHLRVEMSSTHVAEVVEETVKALSGQIEEKNQEIVVDVEDNLPPIWADHTRMVQVLTNLVSNAHKYTPDGGEIWVGVRLETPESDAADPRPALHHWVRDTGIGMSEEELAQIFRKFYRSDRAKEMAQGTGLGLLITRNLVEQHQGKLWVESKVGEGTTFHYTIPAYEETGE